MSAAVTVALACGQLRSASLLYVGHSKNASFLVKNVQRPGEPLHCFCCWLPIVAWRS